MVLVLPVVQVIEGGQINDKVLGQTHLFSLYSFNHASQPVISYKYLPWDGACSGIRVNIYVLAVM
jgi:hypothetical protein